MFNTRNTGGVHRPSLEGGVGGTTINGALEGSVANYRCHFIANVRLRIPMTHRNGRNREVALRFHQPRRRVRVEFQFMSIREDAGCTHPPSPPPQPPSLSHDEGSGRPISVLSLSLSSLRLVSMTHSV